MDSTLLSVFAHEAGELHACGKLIEEWPTREGSPRRDLVAHTRRKLDWLKAMMLSVESDLAQVEQTFSMGRDDSRDKTL